MEDSYILSKVDHTLLNPAATLEDIKKLCAEAIKFKTAAVCVPPSYVEEIYRTYDNRVRICTVIGFPSGYATKPVKEAELAGALLDGATEFDTVVNLGDVKNKRFDRIVSEIESLKKITGDDILKVIIETCYLTEEEKIRLCECVAEGGADYIKTSTGFGPSGAALADIELFKKYLPEEVKIKAAGGIRTREDAVAFLEAGCSRLGISKTAEIFEM